MDDSSPCSKALIPPEIRAYTTTFRTFNLACIVFYFLSCVFMVTYFSYLSPVLIVFYVLYFLFAVANLIFHLVAAPLQVSWVKHRLYSVYAVFGVMLIFYTVSFVLFFKTLEHFNEQTDV